MLNYEITLAVLKSTDDFVLSKKTTTRMTPGFSTKTEKIITQAVKEEKWGSDIFFLSTNGEVHRHCCPPPKWSTNKDHTKTKVRNILEGHKEPQGNI